MLTFFNSHDLFVCIYVPSTAMSFRDGTPFTVRCEGPEAHKYTVPIGNRTRGRRVTVPLCHASSTNSHQDLMKNHVLNNEHADFICI